MPQLIPPVIAPGTISASSQPELTVDELLLRRWRPADAPALVAAYGDPAIQRWHGRSLTDDEALAWIAERHQRWTQERTLDWAICAGDTLLGRIGLFHLDLTEGHGELVYWAVPAARGRGVVTRALNRVTDWAFTEIGFHRLELLHSAHNDASCQVAMRGGYALEGVKRSAALHADGWHDIHLHARVAP